jgi:hypothetical protein
MSAFNNDISSQIRYLETNLLKSEIVREVLARVPELDPYKSTEDATNTWPNTATAIGVRQDSGG